MAFKVDGGVVFQQDGGVSSEAVQAPQQRTEESRTTTTSTATNSVETFKADAGATPAPQPDARPSMSVQELKPQVELCVRAADLIIIGKLGINHHWLRTANKEVGMGQHKEKLPGHGEAPPIGRQTQWIDHSTETEKECVVVPDVDAACVERETEFGRSTSEWVPHINDCYTKTQEVLDACSTKPRPAPGPDFGDPSKTGAGYSL
jgi:hypothetical protein